MKFIKAGSIVRPLDLSKTRHIVKNTRRNELGDGPEFIMLSTLAVHSVKRVRGKQYLLFLFEKGDNSRLYPAEDYELVE